MKKNILAEELFNTTIELHKKTAEKLKYIKNDIYYWFQFFLSRYNATNWSYEFLNRINKQMLAMYDAILQGKDIKIYNYINLDFQTENKKNLDELVYFLLTPPNVITKIGEFNTSNELLNTIVKYEKSYRFNSYNLHHRIFNSLAENKFKQMGIRQYRWLTQEDIRVVGNPDGLYPEPSDIEIHGDHFERNKQIYPIGYIHEDGKIGTALGCRCYMLPIISRAKHEKTK